MKDPDRKKPPALEREPAFDFLDERWIKLRRDGRGHLRLTIAGDRSYLYIKAVKAFPHSEPHGDLGPLDARAGDKVIGIVVDPAKMDATSEQAAEGALQHHHFIPTITRVASLKEEFGAVYIEAETDRGPGHFVARGIRDGIEDLGDGSLLLPDVDGNRYRIADWRHLDPKSRRLLERVI